MSNQAAAGSAAGSAPLRRHRRRVQRHPPHNEPGGAEGGQAGGQGRCWVERPDGERLDRSDQIEFPVEAGDVVGVDTPGGGGYGG
jgi:N-methylhydantoinase B/oxoprolinase/acetone carboxylase alpha subunit